MRKVIGAHVESINILLGMNYNSIYPLFSISFLSKIIFLILLIFLMRNGTKVLAQNSDHQNYSCTQVIGFSQVGQTGSKDQPVPGFGWFFAGDIFESIVDDNRWQLLWMGGAGVNKWMNPEYKGWNQSIISPCNNNSDAPDRVLFSISGPYGKDLKGWSTAMEKAVDTIQQKLPTVEKIILQPVVGGTDGNACSCARNCDFRNSPFQKTFKKVRASWQHKYIVKIIDQVVANQNKGIIVKGYYPEVASCLHYIDGLGHLTKRGAKYIGRKLGNYYK